MILNTNITFEKVSLRYKQIIFDWLNEPHIQEFWDNSPEHKDDILNFVNDRKTPSPYFGGMFSYWIGLYKKEPYSLIMTHEETESTNPPEAYLPYLSKTGKTFGLDFCIGNKKLLGQGLAAPTLMAFMTYFSTKIEPETKTFLIDPYINNPRAIHVYKKAGFRVMSEFVQSGGFFNESKGVIMVKTL